MSAMVSHSSMFHTLANPAPGPSIHVPTAHPTAAAALPADTPQRSAQRHSTCSKPNSPNTARRAGGSGPGIIALAILSCCACRRCCRPPGGSAGPGPAVAGLHPLHPHRGRAERGAAGGPAERLPHFRPPGGSNLPVSGGAGEHTPALNPTLIVVLTTLLNNHFSVHAASHVYRCAPVRNA